MALRLKQIHLNFLNIYSNPLLVAVNVFQDHLQKVKICEIAKKYLLY